MEVYHATWELIPFLPVSCEVWTAHSVSVCSACFPNTIPGSTAELPCCWRRQLQKLAFQFERVSDVRVCSMATVSRGTRTRKRLCWRGPAVIGEHRSDLSTGEGRSTSANSRLNTDNVEGQKNCSRVPESSLTPQPTGGFTDGRSTSKKRPDFETRLCVAQTDSLGH
jgi:hypothetical protein